MTTELERIREVDRLDAATATVLSLRPDWQPLVVRRILATDNRAWRDVIAAALRCALDPEVRSPAAITNHDARRYGQSEAERHPSAVTYAERMAELRRITHEESA
jgi:hypothetical protein